jgi:hypothetical protein
MARKILKTKNNVINFFYKVDKMIYEIGDKLL